MGPALFDQKGSCMRNRKMDNQKGILIVLVVLGHLLELRMGRGIGRFVYILIYFVHMPLFVYCSGYFAKRSGVWRRVFKKLLPPYIVFQCLYLAFARIVLEEEAKLQFLKPYWLLWYLFAMIVWSLALPLLSPASGKKRAVILAVSFAAAIAAGYADSVGRYMSLSRIIVFFPFFLLGYDVRQREKEPAGGAAVRCPSALLVLAAAGLAALTAARMGEWKVSWLYEAASYGKTGGGPAFRLLHLAAGFLGVACAMRFVPDKEWKVFGKLGQKTMPIYLIHGFIVKWIGTWY